MRTGLQLLALLCVCTGACWVCDRFAQPRPILVSGVVVDAATGRPVPHARLSFIGWLDGATADTQGRFQVQPDYAENCCRLSADPPKAGPLLGTALLTNIFARPGHHYYSGLRVYAAAATQISGHVFDETGTPLKFCDVSAHTLRPDRNSEYWGGGSTSTGDSGTFTFDQLGSNRYSLIANCHYYLLGEKLWGVKWRDRLSWRPTYYPNALTISEAREFVLRPGDHISNVDFHLKAVPQYAIRGSVSIGRSSRSLYSLMFNNDVEAVLTSQDLRDAAPSEPCTWPDMAGDFECNFVPAGNYELRLKLKTNFGARLDVPLQLATVPVTVPPPRLCVCT